MYKSTGKSYRQLTLGERYQITAFLEIKRSQTEIAVALNRAKSTMFRESRRNSVDEKYYSAKALAVLCRKHTENIAKKIKKC